MKPSLVMEEKPAATIIQTPEIPYQGRQPSKDRWAHAGFSILLALLAVILVFQVLSYRKLGESSEKTTSKNLPDKVEKNVNYHIEENDVTVNENVVVDNREADLTTEKARMIFDYDRGIVVTKFTDGGSANDSVCYVATFNNSESTGDLKETYLNAEENKEADLDSNENYYESTDETVPKDLLSPKAQQMCTNSKVVMVRKTDKKDLEGTTDRRKRAICYYYWYWCYYICYYEIYYYYC